MWREIDAVAYFAHKKWFRIIEARNSTCPKSFLSSAEILFDRIIWNYDLNVENRFNSTVSWIYCIQ